MNAYVMIADGVHVIEGAGWLEIHPDDIVLIGSNDPERRTMAAVKLSDRLWVAIGEQPPARLPAAGPLAEETPAPPAVVMRKREQLPDSLPIVVADGGWPSEPPPDVDSEG